MRMLLKMAALLGVLLTGCLVPTIDDFNQEDARRCDSENTCLTGYVCVEGRCQPEQGTACRPGTSALCGPDMGECQAGKRPCDTGGAYGPCEGAVSAVDEVCNGKDDDCDGTPDEGLPCDPACTICTYKGRACENGQCGGCLDSHYENGTECIPKVGLGKGCTENRMCDSGFCVDGICCNVSACDKAPDQCFAPVGSCASGTCQYAPLSTGTLCNDGNACTSDDKCNGSGACGGTAKACNTPPGQCFNPTGTCNPATGACTYPPKPAGTGCDDGRGCYGPDVCDGSGACGATYYLCCKNQYCSNNECVCNTSPCYCQL
ncbi:hypothetical protein [Archangium lipolyticum]|uniref:hypothetical protein n=1 Tax=Archangium lipolyticum TaxID=2970465 RepID=UPI00214A5087|nr:hypothetical protein [Archangium lipolyticum]